MAPLLDLDQSEPIYVDQLDENEVDRYYNELLEFKIEAEDDLQHLRFLFVLCRNILQLKATQTQVAFEELEQIATEKAKISADKEQALIDEIDDLKQQLSVLRRQTGDANLSKDAEPLKEEIRFLTEENQRLQRDFVELRNDLAHEKEKAAKHENRAEQSERELRELRKERDQLIDDVRDYQRQLQSQREHVTTRRTETEDYQKKLRSKNQELLQVVDENNNLNAFNEVLRQQVRQLTVTLEESVLQMETTTDKYAKIKEALDESDMVIEKLEEENSELLKKLAAAGVVVADRKTSYEDELILEFNKKVEEWKILFQEKDEELHDCRKKVENLQQEILQYQMDSDRASIMQLTKAIDSRDKQIGQLKTELEAAMIDMEQHSKLMEELQNQMNSGEDITQIQNRRVQELQNTLKFKENLAAEAQNRMREAEKNAIDKDRSIIDLTNRMRRYEKGEYGLSEAVDEIRELKSLLEKKERQNDDLIQHCSKIELQCVNLLDENENLRHKLGIDSRHQSTVEFKQLKQIEQQTDRALNIILQKEVERLEDERIALKMQARKMAQRLGEKAVALGLSAEEALLVDQYAEDLKRGVITADKTKSGDNSWPKSDDRSPVIDNDQENMLRENRALKTKLLQFEKENQELINGLKEIKNQLMSGTSATTDQQLNIPTLDKLLTAIETAHFSENREAYLNMKSELDLNKGRIDELRSELKSVRAELRITLAKLNKEEIELQSVNKLVEKMKNEQAAFSLHGAVKLPDDTPPSTSIVIASLNEQLIKVLHELDAKTEQVRKLDEALQLCNTKMQNYEQEIESSKTELNILRENFTSELNKLTGDLNEAKNNLENANTKSIEFDRLVDSLDLGENDLKRRLGEMVRKSLANGIECKSLARKLSFALQAEDDLRKMHLFQIQENDILKSDLRKVEKSLIEQTHVLQREKEITNYQMSSLQKLTENSIPMSDYQKLANTNADITEKYQTLLKKTENDLTRQLRNETEIENAIWKKEFEYLTKQLQIEKEKSYKLAIALETNYDKANLSEDDSGIGSISELSSVSQKLSAMEMKELNERLRADHFKKIYDETRHQMHLVEGRNATLESQFESLSNVYNELQAKERQYRDEMADSVPRSIHEADSARISSLEENCLNLKLQLDKLTELLEVSQHQSNYYEKEAVKYKLEIDELNKLLRDFESQTDFNALNSRLHREVVLCKLSETSACFDLKNAKENIYKLENLLKDFRRERDDEIRLFMHLRYGYSTKIQRLRSTIADLRRRFSGSIPFKEQEKLTEMMLQASENRRKTVEELNLVAEKETEISLKLVEIEEKDKILQETLLALNDNTGVLKLVEWKQKLEKLLVCHHQDKIQSIRLIEEIAMQKNLIKKLEDIVQNLEEENRQIWKQWEQRESIWEDQEAVFEKRFQKIFVPEKIAENVDEVKMFDYASYIDGSMPLDEQLRKVLNALKNQAKVISELKSASHKNRMELEINTEEKRKLEYDLLKKDSLLLEMKKIVEPTKVLKLEEIVSSEKEEKLSSSFSNFSEIQRQFRQLFEQNELLWKDRVTQKDEAIDGYRQLVTNLQTNLRELNLAFQEEVGRLADKISMLEMEKFGEQIRLRRENVHKHIDLTINYDDAENYIVRAAQVEKVNSVLEEKILELVDKLKLSSERIESLSQENEELRIEFDKTRGLLDQKSADEGLSRAIKPPRLDLKPKSESEESSTTEEVPEDSVPGKQTKLLKSQKKTSTLPSATMSIAVTEVIEQNRVSKDLIWRNKYRQMERRYKENLAENKMKLFFKKMAQLIISLKNEMIQSKQQRNTKDFDNREKEVLSIESEFRSLTHKLNEKMTELAECKQSNGALKSAVKRLEIEMDLLKNAYSKLKKENENLKTELKSTEIRLNHLRGLSREKGVFSTQTDELRRKLEELQEKLKLDEDKTRDKDEPRKPRSEIFYKWNEGKKLQEKIDKLTVQLDSKSKECDATQKILVRMRERIERLEKDQRYTLKALSNKNSSVSDACCQTWFEIESSVKQAINQAVEDDVLRQQLDELKAKNEMLSRTCTELELKIQNSLMNENIPNGSKNHENGEKSVDLIESLRRSLEEAYKERDRLKLDVENDKYLKTEIDELRERYVALKFKYDDLTLENLGLKDEVDQFGKAKKWDVVNRLHARIDELDSENKNLNNQLEDLKFSTARISDSDVQKLVRENKELKEKLARAAPRVAWSEEIYHTNDSGQDVKNGDNIDRKLLRGELASVKKELVQLRFENQKLKLENIDHTKGIGRLETYNGGRLCRNVLNLNVLKNKTLKIIELEQLLKQEIERKHSYIVENRHLNEKVEALQWTPDGKELSDCDALLEQIRKLKLEMVKLEEKQASMKHEIKILKRRIEPLLIENGDIDVRALKERFRMYDHVLKENIDLKLKCNRLEARLLNLSN